MRWYKVCGRTAHELQSYEVVQVWYKSVAGKLKKTNKEDFDQ